MFKYLTALLMMAFVGCTPSYATNGALTMDGCKSVVSASKEIVTKFRAGGNQFEVFKNLNRQPDKYWANDPVAKVYTQAIVMDLKVNVAKGFKDKDILEVVRSSCDKKVGMSI